MQKRDSCCVCVWRRRTWAGRLHATLPAAAARQSRDMWPTGAVRRPTWSSWPPLVLVLVVYGRTTSVAGDGAAFYTDRWAVQVRGGEHVARRLAAHHGFEFIARVSESPSSLGESMQ